MEAALQNLCRKGSKYQGSELEVVELIMLLWFDDLRGQEEVDASLEKATLPPWASPLSLHARASPLTSVRIAHAYVSVRMMYSTYNIRI